MDPSILYPPGYARLTSEPGEPECFGDLNLDQIVHAVTAPYAEFHLAGFFYEPLRSVDAVAYRHDVVRDLWRTDVRSCIDAFGTGMRTVRANLHTASTMRHTLQRERWVLQAASAYRTTVTTLAATLPATGAASAGIRSIADYLARVTASDGFGAFAAAIDRVESNLDAITYTLVFHGSRVTVTRYAGEEDYGSHIETDFARFRMGEAHDHHSELRRLAEMDHVEAGILAGVATLFGDEFAALADFARRYSYFVDPVIEQFDREVHAYLSYLDHTARLRLPFCLPDLTRGKHIEVADAFDLALADKNAAARTPVVTNDIVLDGPARIAVVTGANQGGKTTFARTVGQLHWLAALGLPVPARRARLGLCDDVLTHFERREQVGDLRGKLEDDLVRIRDILARATPATVVILNEVFTSTTADDAELLGRRILGQLIEKDVIGVYVTFIDELAALGPAVASYVATVDPDDPGRRTFRVLRRDADGRAYADTLAARYGLTYDLLRKRVQS